MGVSSIFFKAPLWIEQGYLVIISALVATNLLQLPEWTAFALLGVVAIYDLFAVLCPKGPLKVLVNTAQERNQTIPALLYTSGMADRGNGKIIGAYSALPTKEDDSDSEVDLSRGGVGEGDASPGDGETSSRVTESMETQDSAEKTKKKKKRSSFRRAKKAKATDQFLATATTSTASQASATGDPENPPTSATPAQSPEADDDDGGFPHLCFLTGL